MAFFVAFYPYKGGVGRSLALANTGYALAAHGKRVILVDMDLEAPGLQDVPEFALKGSGPKKGFLDYAASYRKTGRCPAIKSYVHACRESPGSGKLWLMPAGNFGASYQEQLGDLAWRRLHPKHGTEPFVEGFRHALTEEFQPHYVLIDARTGLSDIGGLSTHRLADMVVLVFNLTRSCLEGSVRTYRSFTSPESRVKSVQLVASPVPPLVPGADSIAKRRLDQACELMSLGTAYGRTLIRVDYDPTMVLAEELAVRHSDEFPAAHRYESLRESIQRANPAEVFPVVEQAKELRSAGQLEDGLALLRSFVKTHPQDSQGYLELGDLLFEAGRAEEAAEAFRKATEFAPDLPLPYRRLGEALAAIGQTQAVEALKKAESLGEKSRELYSSLAQAYAQQGDTAQETEARRKAIMALLGDERAAPAAPLQSLDTLRREFVEVLGRHLPFAGFKPEVFWDELMQSLSLAPEAKLQVVRRLLSGSMGPSKIAGLVRILEEEQSRAVEKLGPNAPELRQRVAQNFVDPFDANALLTLRQDDPVDSALLCQVAILPASLDRKIELLEEAVQKDPENPVAWEWLGTYLLLRGQEEQGEPRRELLQRAEKSLSRSANLAPVGQMALYNWGTALAELARLAKGDEKQRLFQEAILKYQETLRQKPDYHDALNNWGTALAELAQLADNNEKPRLFQEAALKYQEAVRHKPDFHEALNNWGLALSDLGLLAEGDEKRQLFQEATLKYREAVRHKPDHHEALNNWANVLLLLIDSVEGEEVRNLASQAAERAREASKFQPGAGDYNLACALSRLEQFDEAAKLLIADLGRRPEMRKHALQDPDFQPLWLAKPELRESISQELSSQ
jgi:tetratricopeptide (TPR) repeat protein